MRAARDDFNQRFKVLRERQADPTDEQLEHLKGLHAAAVREAQNEDPFLRNPGYFRNIDAPEWRRVLHMLGREEPAPVGARPKINGGRPPIPLTDMTERGRQMLMERVHGARVQGGDARKGTWSLDQIAEQEHVSREKVRSWERELRAQSGR